MDPRYNQKLSGNTTDEAGLTGNADAEPGMIKNLPFAKAAVNASETVQGQDNQFISAQAQPTPLNFNPPKSCRITETKMFHLQGSSTRLADVSKLNWKSNGSSYAIAAPDANESGCAKVSHPKMPSILKNTRGTLARNKRSRVSFSNRRERTRSRSKLRNRKNKKSNSTLSRMKFPKSVPDVETYRKYLLRPRNYRGARKARNETDDEYERAQINSTIKTGAFAQAMMSLALLTISGSQLRFALAYEDAHSFPILTYTLLGICIITEIVTGTGYIILTQYEFNDELREKIQTYLTFALTVVAISTIILSSFALETHVCETFILDRYTNEKEASSTEASPTAVTGSTSKTN